MFRIDFQRPLLSHNTVSWHRCKTMEARQNLPVLKMIEGFKVKDDGSAAKAAKQTNPLSESGYSEPGDEGTP